MFISSLVFLFLLTDCWTDICLIWQVTNVHFRILKHVSYCIRKWPSPVHLTGFSTCFFPGFLAIFILLSSQQQQWKIKTKSCSCFQPHRPYSSTSCAQLCIHKYLRRNTHLRILREVLREKYTFTYFKRSFKGEIRIYVFEGKF